MKKYVFFGDSVTEANRNKQNTLDLGEGFVFMLDKEFENIEFFNRGIGGQKVNDLLNRVDEDVINLKPDVCFIWVGVNNAWLPYMLNQPSTLKTFFSDYDHLIKEIKKKSSHTEIVLIKPFAVTGEKSSIDMLKDLEVFRADCDRVAKAHHLKIIDIKDEINKQLVFMPAESIFYDGIHPSPLGHEIIKESITDFIRGNLNDI